MSKPSERAEPFDRVGLVAQLWLGLLGPAAVWLVQFQTLYALVPWVCVHGHAAVLHTVSAVAMLLTTGLGALAWAKWRQAGAAWPSEQSDRVTRTRFMAVLGLMSCGFFFLLIGGQALAMVFIDPCRT